MTFDNENSFFQTGYQLGLANNDTELTNQENAMDDACTKLEAARGECLEKGKLYLAKMNETIRLLVQEMRLYIQDLKSDRKEFLQQVSIEWDLLRTMGKEQPQHLQDVREKSKAILERYENDLKNVSEKLKQELIKITLADELNNFKQDLKNHFDQLVDIVQEQKAAIRLGYGKGKAVYDQIGHLGDEDKQQADSDDEGKPDGGVGSPEGDGSTE